MKSLKGSLLLIVLLAYSSTLVAQTVASPAKTLYETPAGAVPPGIHVFKTLVNFTGQNGSTPLGVALVQGTDGNFYGTTEDGGAHGLGTVFKVTPGGTLTVLHSFSNTPDGAYPKGGVVLGNSGKFFYGTTSQGGSNGLGTFFKITSGGTLTTLHSFNGTDGQFPPVPCVEGTDNNFYGVTSQGGANGFGTVFQITATGTLTTLHSFNGTDGSNPQAVLVPMPEPDLILYGTTNQGGTNNLGTFFSVTPAGQLTTLHSFNGTDGANPQAALYPQPVPDLIFYGTTNQGGTNNLGTFFSVTPTGTVTTLHSFNGTDGQYPAGALVLANDGNFYGTTAGVVAPGIHVFGQIFEITPAGAVTALHTFCSQGGTCTDGSYPYGGLAQRTTGVFFGVTSAGGSAGMGTAFSLSTGLGAFVETLPNSGSAGASIIILGTKLTGATSVTFNGVAATFTVKSSSEITTTVPNGATTGPVVVVTPGGTLTSNVNFTVP
jgi:uncharacterized repeat protein (TIGR03803 family)